MLTFTAKNQTTSLRNALYSSLKFVDAKDLQVTLQGVNFRRNGDNLVITATDRYRLVETTIPGKFSNDEELDVTFSNAFAKEVLGMFKGDTIKAETLSLKFTRTKVTVKIGKDSSEYATSFACIKGDYPKVGKSLFAPFEKREKKGPMDNGADAFRVNPKFMRDMMDVFIKWGCTESVVQIISVNRPVFTEFDGGFEDSCHVRMLLMPMRF